MGKGAAEHARLQVEALLAQSDSDEEIDTSGIDLEAILRAASDDEDDSAGAGGAGALLGLSLAIAPLDGSAAFSTRVSGACLGGRGRAGRAWLRAPSLSPARVSRSS